MTPYTAWASLMQTHYGLERAGDVADAIRAGTSLGELADSLARNGCPPEEAATLLGAARYVQAGWPGPDTEIL